MTLPLAATAYYEPVDIRESAASLQRRDDRDARDQRRDAQADTQSNADWCRDAERNNDDDYDVACEVREYTMRAGAVEAETSNGGIRVTGERRNDIHVRVLVAARARNMDDARDIMKQVSVTTDGGRVRATGPRNRGNTSWWTSYRIAAPQNTDLELYSSNGGLRVTGVRGRMRLRTSNGGITIADAGGDVQADTSNGSITATLSGRSWDGAGLDLTTSNGSVRVEVPDNYNARIVAGTSNGSLNLDFPITVSGRLNKEIDTTLGSGGPTVRVRTSNGSVSLRRR